METGHTGDEHPTHHPHKRRGLIARFRANFLTGLVVMAPVSLTFWLIWKVTGWIDSWVLPFIPQRYRPTDLIQDLFCATPLPGQGPDDLPFWCVEGALDLRGIGVIIFLIFTVFIGWIAKGILGRSLIAWGESMVDRMPVVRSIYNGVKQVTETVFNQTESKFDKACLIEYPRPGIWAIGFVSTAAKGEVLKRLPEDEVMTVFLPTTPNPTSGFLLYVPKQDVTFLDMSVEDAAKLVISAGLVYPSPKPAKTPAAGPVRPAP
ncbi:DUF502 domain-containing protein [Defluviimonas sp. WL0075]|uniref:DUF502 domain-containing protein n=1 Tax=Albidovulum sediminicola TaxID=2984331 RepID=A0ABT2Z3N1_9RHOB|nr:DUF502 domain-containing protein [Defluviimonas sp. WL0075]MCV2865748.1 DUF502 domain-containing protein [Defluviimonas sp. WL0075]